MTAHQRWTQTDITDLRSRVQSGQPVTAIADALQRSPDIVQAMMARLRLRGTPLN